MTPSIIIPARLDSTRFPRKLLHPIGGKPLLQWTWLAARRTGLPVVIAAQDAEIAQVAWGFGARAIMTGPCENGTERCAQAASILGLGGPIVNWQGDSPLCPPEWIEALVERLAFADVATPVTLRPDGDGAVPWASTFAVCNGDGRALYFSRLPLPPNSSLWRAHVGLYAYRAEALRQYGRSPSELEQAERLEQLRWFELDKIVECVEFDHPPIPEVNEPADVDAVKAVLLERICAVA